MIQVQHLIKLFGNFRAVDDITFEVQKGEVLGFLGPNGAGKSTTMRMLTGFFPPSSGTAVINGYDILKDSLNARRQIGYLPENAPVYPDMTVEGYLKFIAEVRGFSGSELKKKFDRAVEICSLEKVLPQTVDTLSKGYKQRVCFAQAILPDPPVLILDEPTDGLDPNQKFEVRRMISGMAENKCIILSTHILEEVDAVCTRAIIIANGKIVANGSPSELRKKSSLYEAVTLSLDNVSAEEAKSAFMSLANVANTEILKEENGAIVIRVLPSGGNVIAPAVAEEIRRRNWRNTQFSVEEGRLDEVFRNITRQ
ncbi:ABC transporter ATP-binding protein [bacterium]|jgi:ABC-2 type transport system ATP-binding protein|nr:ABC transporter ATP-binding protein [bacterium]